MNNNMKNTSTEIVEIKKDDTVVIKVKKLIRTCSAFPTQYDMWDDKGNYYYLRFRCGTMSIDKNERPMIYGDYTINGNEFAGECEFEDFVKFAKIGKIEIILDKDCIAKDEL